MSLFGFGKPAHRSKDPQVRLEALESIADETLLAEIAKTDASPRVRQAAVAKVTDQDLLMGIALDGQQIDARIAAVERIESQEKLAEIIKIRKNFQLMGACFARITDKKILEAIANDKAYNISARRMAIENFADESFLAEVTQHRVSRGTPKSRAQIDTLVERYGGVRLARALGRFRGSPNAISALGDIMRHGGEAGVVALEYLVQALGHGNREVANAAQAELAGLNDGELIAHLIGMMENASLQGEILKVLRGLDHPDARQAVDSIDS